MPIARRLLYVFALLLAASSSGSSQTRPDGPIEAAAQALNAGQYDRVAALVADSTDPRGVVLKAEAEIQRGRYTEAIALLTPAATANAGGDAALELGLLQIYLGRRADGARTLQRVLQASRQSSAADFLRLGRAARALGESQEANAYFRDADRAQPKSVDVNVAWGELFLEKAELEEAQKSFTPALRTQGDNVRAMMGMAKIALEENPPQAKEILERLLKVNPRYVPAHLALAEVALGNRRRDEARVSIREALDTNPQSLEALALDGAVARVEGRTADFERRTAEVLKLNPGYGEVYRVAGDQLAINYRFDEAVELTRRAVQLDPSNTRAHADLGLQLLRTGDETAARASLETAFKADSSYANLMTRNLLEMLDQLDKYVTITDGDIIMKFHAEEAAVMREEALPLAKRAVETLSTQWDFKPQGPLLIEMFQRHDDFAVRTVGLPGMVGALGACFGRVVTLDSPRARPPGQFAWQETLWHEIAHVITLQMSNNRVPRWLTEGISVFEERRGSPEWGREMTVSFAQAMNADKVLKLKDLNDGFTDPELISLAYYESSLLVEHLSATYGEPSLRTLLRAYGKGLEGDAALKEAFNATAEQIQVTFDQKLEKDFGATRRALRSPEVPRDADLTVLRAAVAANEGSFPLRMRLGAALRESGDHAGAIREFERAAQLVPHVNGDDNPNRQIAVTALDQKDNARAMQALEAMLKVDSTDVESARQLVALAVTANNTPVATGAYERVAALDPFDATAQSFVGRQALQRRDGARAVRAFKAAVAAGAADRAVAHVDLAEALLMTGDRTEARRNVLAALEIAPSFERAQDLLLRIAEGGA